MWRGLLTGSNVVLSGSLRESARYLFIEVVDDEEGRGISELEGSFIDQTLDSGHFWNCPFGGKQMLLV